MKATCGTVTTVWSNEVVVQPAAIEPEAWTWPRVIWLAGPTAEHGRVTVVEIEMVVGGSVAADGAGVPAGAAAGTAGAEVTPAATGAAGADVTAGATGAAEPDTGAGAAEPTTT